MYLYQPCLISMALFAWANKQDKRWLPRVLSFLILLAVSGFEWDLEWIRLYPAAVLLPPILLLDWPHQVNWAEVLTASMLGGLICWKVADAWPLLSLLEPLCAALLTIPILLICRNREDRSIACAVGGLVFELFFCVREYMLFSFCVIRLGSHDSFSLSTAAIFLWVLVEPVCQRLHTKKKYAFSMAK